MSAGHILVVDDDMTIGAMLEMLLDEEGYAVSLAYRGWKARCPKACGRVICGMPARWAKQKPASSMCSLRRG